MRSRRRIFAIVLAVLVALPLAIATQAASAAELPKYPHYIYKSDATDTTITISWYPTKGTKTYGVCVTPASQATDDKTCKGAWRRAFPNYTDTRQPKKGYNFTTIDALKPNSNYKIQVRSYADTASTYAKRQNEYRNPITYATTAYASSSPKDLALTAGSSGGKLDATWSPVGNSNYELRYSLQRPNGSDTTAFPPKASTCTTTSTISCVRTTLPSAKLAGLTPGKEYYAWVRAVDAKAEGGDNPLPRSPWSSVATSEKVSNYSAEPPTFTAPSNFTAGGFTVNWNTPSGFQAGQKYLVFASTTPGIVSGKTSAWVVSGNSVDIGSGATPVFGGGIGPIDRTQQYSINIAVVPGSAQAGDFTTAAAIDGTRLSNFPPETRIAVNGVRDITAGAAKDPSGLNRLKLSWTDVPVAAERYYKVFVDADGADGSSDSVCVQGNSVVLDAAYSLGGSAAKLEPRRTYYVKVAAFSDPACTSTDTAAWSDTWTAVKTPNEYDLDAPAPFRMKASGASAIEFEWDQAGSPGSEVRYQIERKSGSGGWTGQRTTTAAGQKSILVSGLATSTTYTWRVRAVDLSDQALSPWSVEIKVKPSDGQGTISGQVQNVGGSVAAVAFRTGGNRDGDLAGASPVGSDGRYVIKDLEPGASYTVRLQQRDTTSSRVSPWIRAGSTNGVRKRIDTATPADAGTRYTVPKCAAGQDVCPSVPAATTTLVDGVTLSGSLPANYGVVDVTALYGTDAIGSDRKNTAASDQRTYAIRGLWPASMGGGNYTVRLTVSGALKSSKSITGVVANRTLNFAGEVPPATPTGLTITPTGPTTATVSWQAVSGAELYRFWVGTSPSGSNPTPTMHETSSTSKSVSGLAPNTTYYVDVAAVRGEDRSAYSSPRQQFTTPTTSGGGATPSDAPTNLRVVSTSGQAVTVGWSTTSAQSRLYSGTRNDGGGLTKADVDGTTFTRTGLSNGCWFFKVAERNGADTTSAYTLDNQLVAQVPAQPSFGTPGCLNARKTPTGSGRLSISWASVPEASGYRIYYGAGSAAAKGSGMTKLDVSGGSTTHTVLSGLSAKTTYYVKIAAMSDSVPWSGYTANGAASGTSS